MKWTFECVYIDPIHEQRQELTCRTSLIAVNDDKAHSRVEDIRGDASVYSTPLYNTYTNCTSYINVFSIYGEAYHSTHSLNFLQVQNYATKN